MKDKLKHLLKKLPPAQKAADAARRQAQRRKFSSDFREFQKLSAGQPARFKLDWEDRYPCLDDNTGGTGFDWHYVFHTAWAARVVAETKPARHVDISSSLYFCSIVSAFVPIDFYDYRPAELNLDGLTSGRADLMALPFADGSVASLSCMHVVEHIGLGRYGDPIDPQGDLKAMAELRRVLAPGGTLIFVTPVGKPKIQFNAHRIYACRQIVENFPGLVLEEFALQPDSTCELVRNASFELADAQNYACGCFRFRRP